MGKNIPSESGDFKDGGDVGLEDIMKKCMDAPGYVLFVGCVSHKRNDKGFNLLDFFYRRHNYSWEDTKKAIAEFEKAYRRDIDDS